MCRGCILLQFTLTHRLQWTLEEHPSEQSHNLLNKQTPGKYRNILHILGLLYMYHLILTLHWYSDLTIPRPFCFRAEGTMNELVDPLHMIMYALFLYPFLVIIYPCCFHSRGILSGIHTSFAWSPFCSP